MTTRGYSAYGCAVVLTLLAADVVTIILLVDTLEKDIKASGLFSMAPPANWGATWQIVFGLWVFVAIALVIANKLVSERWRLQLQHVHQVQEQKFRALTISNIDSMSGVEFEHYLQRILRAQGFEVRATKGSGDLGVDLIAVRASESVAIQVKRYGSKISAFGAPPKWVARASRC